MGAGRRHAQDRGRLVPGIATALRRLKIRRKRGRLSVTSPDPAYAVKLQWIERVRKYVQTHPTTAIVVYGDEYSLYRQAALGDCYFTMHAEPHADLSHRTNTRHRYAGFLEGSRGEVLWQDGFKVGVHAHCQSLTKLRERYPTHRLFLIWDSWPVHAHPTVLAKASELTLEILWLPTYAPWTNPIEKLWRWLAEDMVRYVGLLPD